MIRPAGLRPVPRVRAAPRPSGRHVALVAWDPVATVRLAADLIAAGDRVAVLGPIRAPVLRAGLAAVLPGSGSAVVAADPLRPSAMIRGLAAVFDGMPTCEAVVACAGPTPLPVHGPATARLVTAVSDLASATRRLRPSAIFVVVLPAAARWRQAASSISASLRYWNRGSTHAVASGEAARLALDASLPSTRTSRGAGHPDPLQQSRNVQP